MKEKQGLMGLFDELEKLEKRIDELYDGRPGYNLQLAKYFIDQIEKRLMKAEKQGEIKWK